MTLDGGEYSYLGSKQKVFCKSDKKPDFCNVKTMGKNDFIRPTFFIGVSLPSQTMYNFKRAFFGPLYYEILPYAYKFYWTNTKTFSSLSSIIDQTMKISTPFKQHQINRKFIRK